MGNKYDLPNLADIFSDLQQGKHLCYEDDKKYFPLVEMEKDYKACFDALGYELVHHPRGFFISKQIRTKPIMRISNRWLCLRFYSLTTLIGRKMIWKML